MSIGVEIATEATSQAILSAITSPTSGAMTEATGLAILASIESFRTSFIGVLDSDKDAVKTRADTGPDTGE